MHDPAHPGASLADTILHKDGGITLMEFAKRRPKIGFAGLKETAFIAADATVFSVLFRAGKVLKT
jgi:hypothetical protein